MDSPIVTVLITTYNYGPFVEEAIDSVLSQNLPLDQVEILVVDDGSTDDTSERVKRYGSRIEYFYKPNGGQASALNFGIAKARGEIIALLDADDVFLPGKLARIAGAFQEDPSLGMVYHRLQEWHMRTDERRDWEFFPVSGDLRTEADKFVLYVPQPTSATAYRRSSLKRLLPVPEKIRMLADCYLVTLIPFLAPILAIPEVLGVYRIHGENSYSTDQQHLSVESRKSRLRMWQIVIDAMRKWLEDNGYTRNQAPVRSLFDRWNILLEGEEFAVTPPGRIRFFRFLMKWNRLYGAQGNWKLRSLNCANAIVALAIGYRGFPVLTRLEERVIRFVGGAASARGVSGSGSGTDVDAAMGD